MAYRNNFAWKPKRIQKIGKSKVKPVMEPELQTFHNTGVNSESNISR